MKRDNLGNDLQGAAVLLLLGGAVIWMLARDPLYLLALLIPGLICAVIAAIWWLIKHKR